jgi:hypothetical protein
MQFSIRADQTVIGYNAEMADLDRPHGEIFGFVHNIVGESANGQRFVMEDVVAITHYEDGGETDASPITLDSLNAIAKAFANDGTDISQWKGWREIEPAYGSPAYIDGSYEAQYAAAERMAG